jgi:hypothetical protein
MITKTALSAWDSLWVVPHAVGYYTGDESAGNALLGAPVDMAAVKLSDYTYNKIFKPNPNHTIFASNEKIQKLDPVTKKMVTMENPLKKLKWYNPKKWKLGTHWGKGLLHGVGKNFLWMTPFLGAGSMVSKAIGDRIMPHTRNVYNEQVTYPEQQPAQSYNYR